MELAEKYFLLSYDQGNYDTLYYLPYIYIKQNKSSLAEEYFLRGISTGCPNMMAHYGTFCLEIKGDLELAEKYLLAAASQGNIIAINNLAVLYSKEGPLKNDELAYKYFMIAIENGSIDAIFNFAVYCDKLDHRDLAYQFLIESTLNFDNKSRIYVNSLLHKEFNFEVALILSNFIDNDNSNIMNEIICFITNHN